MKLEFKKGDFIIYYEGDGITHSGVEIDIEVVKKKIREAKIQTVDNIIQRTKDLNELDQLIKD